MVRLAAATLATCLFFVVFIALLETGHALGAFLKGLNTFAGSGVFFTLWLSAWVAAGRVARPFAEHVAGSGLFPVERIIRAGAVTALLTVAIVLAAALVDGIATSEIDAAALPLSSFFFLIVFAVSSVVGAGIGLVAALVAFIAAKAARATVPGT